MFKVKILVKIQTFGSFVWYYPVQKSGKIAIYAQIVL